jgi:hypothetical protein
MNPERFQAAISRIDAVNARDPRGYELPYAQRLTEWLSRLAPAASEELRLAAHAQHIARWEIPRDRYPAGRAGYLQWREDLKQFHARRAGEILTAVGYPPATVARVQDLIRKRDFPRNPEGRVLEDALCLVFLETQLAAATEKTGAEKMTDILRKTWHKMTPAGRALARGLPMSPAQRALVERAVTPPGSP